MLISVLGEIWINSGHLHDGIVGDDERLRDKSTIHVFYSEAIQKYWRIEERTQGAVEREEASAVP